MREDKVANLLRRLRKEYGYSQSDLADKLDVTFQAVSKWERGENLPDAYTLIELAKVYSITVDEILNGQLLIRYNEETEIPTKRLYMLLALGIILIVGSPISMFLFEPGSRLAIIIMIVFFILGIGSVVYAGSQIDDAERKNGQKKELSKKQSAIYGIAFVIFFVSGASWGVWYISWLSFIIAWIIISFMDKEE